MRTNLPDPRHHADLAVCRAMLRDGSRTFLAASRLLPRRTADPAIALYAFCRAADDAIDKAEELVAVALARLQRRLDRLYAGRPDNDAVDRAFAEIVMRFGIPRALPDALLEGLAWDAAGRRYADLPALRAYAMRVAGTVGLMMARIMDVRAPDTLARACDLGVAMQLTNIARDVAEDAHAGRLYLPLAWLAEAGIDPDDFLRAPRQSPALTQVVARLLSEADSLYVAAENGIRALPPACRLGMRVAGRLYAAIGDDLRARGCDPMAGRAFVPASRKLRLVATAAWPRLAGLPITARAPLPEAVSLIDGALAAMPRLAESEERGSRFLWTLALFERLERLDRTRRGLVSPSI